MLVLKDAADLKKYLEVRKSMASAQFLTIKDGLQSRAYAAGTAGGMVYAFDEAIKAVEALLKAEQEAKALIQQQAQDSHA